MARRIRAASKAPRAAAAQTGRRGVLAAVLLCCALSRCSSSAAPARPCVDACIVGGGPAGLTAAIALRKQGLSVTVLESRREDETFEKRKAFLYRVDFRGKKVFDAMGEDDFEEELAREGVMDSAFRLTTIHPDKRGAKARVSAMMRGESDVKEAVWLPRATLLRLLSRRAAASGATILHGANVTEIAHGTAADGRLRVAFSSAGGDAETLDTRLLIGGDGLRSGVRRFLQQRSADRFTPVPLPSASAGLRYKMLSVPGDLRARDLSAEGAVVATEPTGAYSITSSFTAKGERLRLGLLPCKDASVPRTANIIKPPGHRVWRYGPGDLAAFRAYLQDAFPQLDAAEAFPEDELRSFLTAPPGAFPAPQFTRGAAEVFRDGAGAPAAAALLIGDAIHSFPPDLGQGVNAALEDVRGLYEAAEAEGLRGGGGDAAFLGRLEAVARRYDAERAREAEALCRCVQCGFPFQYNQSVVREKVFFLGIALRALAAGVAAKVGLGGVFARPVAMEVTRLDLPYSTVWKRAIRTTRIFQAAAAVAAAALLRRCLLL